MKRWRMVLTVLLGMTPQLHAEEPLVRLAVGEYVPYSSKHMQGNGLTLHIISEAFRQSGYRVQYRFSPWARTWKRALHETGVDGTAYWFPSEERARHFHYSDPILREEYVFFHLATLPVGSWSSLEDLKPYRIGATRAYTYTPRFHELANNGGLQVEFVNRDLQNYRKLLRGRVDLVPSEMLGGYYQMRLEFSNEELGRITFNPRPLMTTDQHLLLRRNRPRSPALLAAFNRGLGILKDSGQVDRWLNELREGRFDPASRPAGVR